MGTTSTLVDRVRPGPDVVVAGVALVAVEVLVVVVYLLVAPVYPTRPLYYAVPFVWINAALWGVARADPAAGSHRDGTVAVVLALAYLGVLGYAGGLWGPGLGPRATGLRVATWSLPPGWGPALLYGGERVVLALLPFKLIGYAALSYLVYATVIDASSSAAAGLLGLLSCVSCTLPVLAALVSGVVGGAGALASAALAQSYPLSTVVYVLTVGLLVYRPGAGSFSRWRTN
jgi:hypothetical protein